MYADAIAKRKPRQKPEPDVENGRARGRLAEHGPWTLRRGARVLGDFVRQQLASCLFAILIFVGLAVTAVVDLPWPRYDALLVYALAITLILWLTKWESNREVGVIFAFHLLGVGVELWGVHVGSWSYPDEGVLRLAGVPLYSGFMYAAVGSYICQAWRRLDMRVTEYRKRGMTIVAGLMYLNFFANDFLPDARIPLAFAALVVLGRTRLHFSVGGERFHWPLSVGLALVGAAVWVAENLGTFLGAWRWSYQQDVWEMVHVGTMGSWAILVTLSFALIATVKSYEGTLYGHDGDRASVEGAFARRAAREHPYRGVKRPGATPPGEATVPAPTSPR